jgi:release factor glutamine methyltransferase
MLTEVLDCDRARLYAHPERPVPPEPAEQFEAMTERRVEGEPLQHILGHASFYGLQLQVSPEVMIPRPETEHVVKRALACIEDTERPRVLDVGTGSGCIALALRHERPGAFVHACDVSTDALAVAQANARTLELHVRFLEADVSADEVPRRVPGDLDLLVSNPPYIPDAEADTLPAVVREYDPAVALFVGEDPLHFYRSLADWGQELCVPGANVVFEVHPEYAEEVMELLRREGFAEVRREDDMGGRPRVVWGQIPKGASG